MALLLLLLLLLCHYRLRKSRSLKAYAITKLTAELKSENFRTEIKYLTLLLT